MGGRRQRSKNKKMHKAWSQLCWGKADFIQTESRALWDTHRETNPNVSERVGVHVCERWITWLWCDANSGETGWRCVCVLIPVNSFNGSVWMQDKNSQAYAHSLRCVVWVCIDVCLFRCVILTPANAIIIFLLFLSTQIFSSPLKYKIVQAVEDWRVYKYRRFLHQTIVVFQDKHECICGVLKARIRWIINDFVKISPTSSCDVTCSDIYFLPYGDLVLSISCWMDGGRSEQWMNTGKLKCF